MYSDLDLIAVGMTNDPAVNDPAAAIDAASAYELYRAGERADFSSDVLYTTTSTPIADVLRDREAGIVAAPAPPSASWADTLRTTLASTGDLLRGAAAFTDSVRGPTIIETTVQQQQATQSMLLWLALGVGAVVILPQLLR